MAIWGNNTPTTSNAWMIGRGRYMGIKMTAPGDGVVDRLYMYCNGAISLKGYGVGLYQRQYSGEGGSLVRDIGGVYTSKATNGWAWRNGEVSPTLTIVAGMSYYFMLWGPSGSDYMYIGSMHLSPNISSNIVSSLTALPPLIFDYSLSLYFTYTPTTPPGPSLKIEGITPGKLEGTSWSNISTVR